MRGSPDELGRITEPRRSRDPGAPPPDGAVPPLARPSSLGHGDQGIEVFLPWREELISNAAIRSTHEGILASLIDLTGLFAVLAKTASAIATVDLRVDYHRTAAPGNLLARAEVLKLGSRVSSAETFVRTEDGTVVASGRGVYLTTD